MLLYDGDDNGYIFVLWLVYQGGEPDVDTVAKMILYDWQRGKLPWFSAPPFSENNTAVPNVPPKQEEVKSEQEVGHPYLSFVQLLEKNKKRSLVCNILLVIYNT